MLGGDITLCAVRKIEQRGLRDGKKEGATLVRGGVFMSGSLFVHQFLDNFFISLTPSLNQGNKLSLTISHYSLFNVSYSMQSDIMSQHLCRARGQKTASYHFIFGIIEQNIGITIFIV